MPDSIGGISERLKMEEKAGSLKNLTFASTHLFRNHQLSFDITPTFSMVLGTQDHPRYYGKRNENIPGAHFFLFPFFSGLLVQAIITIFQETR